MDPLGPHRTLWVKFTVLCDNLYDSLNTDDKENFHTNIMSYFERRVRNFRSQCSAI